MNSHFMRTPIIITPHKLIHPLSFRNYEIPREGAVSKIPGFYPALKTKLSIVSFSVLSHTYTDDWRAISEAFFIGCDFKVSSDN